MNPTRDPLRRCLREGPALRGFLGALVALSTLAAGCGARTTLPGGEGGGPANGSAVTTISSGPGSTASSGGGLCNLPPPPSPTQPTKPGCYTNMGSGWVEVPCLCALWLENTHPVEVGATLRLTVSPPDLEPTLGGPLDVEIALADPTAAFFDVWAKDPRNGTGFSVANDGQTTTLRMGAPDLTLISIPVAACTTVVVDAHIGGGAFAPKLDLHAELDDGMSFATTDNACSNPPPT